MKLVLAAVLSLACVAALAQQRSLRCTAVPACAQPGGSHCKGVQRTYTGAAAAKAKDSIVQACVKANQPDRCNCVQQCRQVAQCSKN